jgi:hypothetical protein
MSNSVRQRVYQVIDIERENQDNKWGGYDHDKYHSLSDWLIFMEIFLNKAKEARRGSDLEVIEELRKVIALGVACLETTFLNDLNSMGESEC